MRPSFVGPVTSLSVGIGWLSTAHEGVTRLDACVRGWTLGAAALAGIILGSALDLEWARRSALRSVACAVALAAPLGALVGFGKAIPLMAHFEAEAWAGALAGAALAPALAAFVVLAKPREVARAGSLLWELHARAMWTLAATWFCIGTVAAVVATMPADHTTYRPLMPLTVGIEAVAIFVTTTGFLKMLLVHRRLMWLRAYALVPADGKLVCPEAEHIDLGVGVEEVGRVSRAKEHVFRDQPRLDLLVRGDFLEAARMTRAPFNVTSGASVCTLACAIAQIALFAVVGNRFA